MIRKAIQRLVSRSTIPKCGLSSLQIAHIKEATTVGTSTQPLATTIPFAKGQNRDFIHHPEINEEFTDQEMEMQLRDDIDGVDILHKGFHEKYLDFNEIQSMNYQAHNKNHSSAVINSYRRNNNYSSIKSQSSENNDGSKPYYNHSKNYNNSYLNSSSQMTSEENKLHSNNPSYNQLNQGGNNLNQTNNSFNIKNNGFNPQKHHLSYFQVSMKNIEETISVPDKLQVIEEFLLNSKKYGLKIDNLQKEALLQVLAPIIKSFKLKPDSQGQKALFYLQSISRDDFLNIHLDQKILNQIRIIVQADFEKLQIEDIKRVFYGSCLRHKSSLHVPIIEAHVCKAWVLRIQDKVIRGQSNERELVLFFSYLCKDNELFRKMNKFILHLILSWESGILMNGELLKTLISVLSKSYLSQQQIHDHTFQMVFSLFFQTFHHLLADRRISNNQFHVILKNLLRSPLFLSAFYTKAAYTPEEWDSIIIQRNQCYAEIDRFVLEQIEHFSANQVLNILNFYNIINLQSSRGTVIQLMQRFHKKFQQICDNFFSFNITLRTLCLYNIENPQAYLSLYSAQPLQLPQLQGNYIQISQAYSILNHLLPGLAYLIEFPELQPIVRNDNVTLKTDITSSMLKKNSLAIITSILHKISAQFIENKQIDNAFSVDIFIQAPPKFPSSPYSINQLPQCSFALDVLSEQDYTNDRDLAGPLTLKYKILKKLGIHLVCVTPSFSQHLVSLPTQQLQQKALFGFLLRQQQQQISKQQPEQEGERNFFFNQGNNNPSLDAILE